MAPSFIVRTLCSSVLIAVAAGCDYGPITRISDVLHDAAAPDAAAPDAAITAAGSDASNLRGDSGHASDAAGPQHDDDAGAVPTSRDPIVQIGSGVGHSCARFESGRVKCWGFNDRGQLGYGDTENRGDAPNEMGDALPFVALGKGRHAVSLAVGRKVTCVLLDDNRVKCWGYNAEGQLGIGSWCVSDCDTQLPVVDNRGDEPNEMGDALPAIALGTKRVMQLAVGGEIACVLLDDSSLRCWGRNSYGALGQSGGCSGVCGEDKRGDAPGEMGASIPAVDVGTGLSVRHMSLGWDYVLVLLSDGSIKAWGNNDPGQLGLGDVSNRGDGPNEMGDALPRVLLPTGKKATRVYAGVTHSCARLDDGTLRCWGDNSYGQLGVGDTTFRCNAEGSMECSALAEVLPQDTAQSVALGNVHSCVIRKQGDLRCFGYNDEGQLGLGDTIPRGDSLGELAGQAASVPLQSGHRYVAVSSGHTFSCGLTDEGRVRCWGVNEFGQLGLGDPRSRGTLPTDTDGPIDVDLGSH